MIKNFRIVTITHKQLNAEDLEHFLVKYDDDKDKTEKLHRIKDRFAQDEMIYLATCNRVIFFFYGHHSFTQEHSKDLLYYVNPELAKSYHHRIERLIEFHEGIDAINHLFEVASSIDSLVIGEREIFRQFREAYISSKKAGLCSDRMRIVEKSVVKAAKNVYTNTDIAAKPVSIVSLAIQEFLKRDLQPNAKILLIGSGETNTTVGRFLKKHGYRQVLIFNRTFDNALRLSEELGASAMHLNELDNYRDGFDCIFACTSAQEPIINLSVFNNLCQDKKEKLIIDLAIPHNVSNIVAELAEVDYISIDSVRSLAEENMKKRSEHIGAARKILRIQLEEFKQLWERRKVEKAFGSLPSEINKVKKRALNKVYKEAIEKLPHDAQSLIHEIADYMEKKCVAVPMKMAKADLQ